MHSKISAVVALLHITNTSRLLEVLKGDSKAIFTAASLATRAVDYLYGLQPKNEPAPETDNQDGKPSRPAGETTADDADTELPRGPR